MVHLMNYIVENQSGSGRYTKVCLLLATALVQFDHDYGLPSFWCLGGWGGVVAPAAAAAAVFRQTLTIHSSG